MGRRKGLISPSSIQSRNDEDYRPNEARRNTEPTFMEVLHPFESLGLTNGKELTPIQKAITKCIIDHGGSASENDILEFVSKKWKIINNKSAKPFQVQPCMRLIRLNFSIKKQNRALFLPDPSNKGNYILGTGAIDETASKHEQPESDFEYEEEKKEPAVELIDIEKKIYDYIASCDGKATFMEICEKFRDTPLNDSLFGRLSYERNLRARLIIMKLNKILMKDDNSESWCTPKYYESLKNQKLNMIIKDSNSKITGHESLSISDLWQIYQSHSVSK